MNLEWICWDCDGTLFPITPKLEQEIFQQVVRVYALERGISLAQAEVEYRALLAIEFSHTRSFRLSNIDPRLATHAYCSPPLEDHVNADPELAELFRSVHGQGIRHCIFSNTNLDHVVDAMNVLGISRDYVQFIVVPDRRDVLNKPHPSGFKRVIERSEVSASKILMVGDRYEMDLKPARLLGMQTAYVAWRDPTQVIWENSEEKPNYVLKTPIDVISLIDVSPRSGS